MCSCWFLLISLHQQHCSWLCSFCSQYLFITFNYIICFCKDCSIFYIMIWKSLFWNNWLNYCSKALSVLKERIICEYWIKTFFIMNWLKLMLNTFSVTALMSAVFSWFVEPEMINVNSVCWDRKSTDAADTSVCRFISNPEFNKEWSEDLYCLNKECDWFDWVILIFLCQMTNMCSLNKLRFVTVRMSYHI